MKLHNLLPQLFHYKAAFLGVAFTSLAGTLLFIVAPAGGEVARTIARQQTVPTQEIVQEFAVDPTTLSLYEEEFTQPLPVAYESEITDLAEETSEPLWQSQEDVLPSIPQSEAMTTPEILETTAVVIMETTVEVTEETRVEEPVLVAASGAYDGSMAYRVLDLVNTKRTESGFPALVWTDTLAASAGVRAPEIVVLWDHTRPDGSPWYTAGAGLQMGENLAYGQTTPEQVVEEWMASPSHAENILRVEYSEMGVSCYLEGGVYYWVQHFA